MNAQNLSRLLYRLLLRLHPAAFRHRFGEEMLWIFDLASSRGQIAYLLFDGVRSVTIQRAKVDLGEEAVPPFGLEIQTSGLTLGRVGQAAALSAVILVAIASLLAREMPSALYFEHNQQPTCGQIDEPTPKASLGIRP
jgi:hypothetical protein